MNSLDQITSSFKDKSLLAQAFTHRSWVNENPGKERNNERLEFLGDAILEFAVSQAIFGRLPDKEEGYLTALRASLVNTSNLATIAVKLDLGTELRLSRGEDDGGGRKNASLLANTVEALVGAIYLDRGMEAASEFIEKNVLSEIDEKLKEPLKDAKSRLQELIQAKGLPAPTYTVTSQQGPDHNKIFVLEVVSEGKKLASGEGKSKAQAEQEAAANALTKLG